MNYKLPILMFFILHYSILNGQYFNNRYIFDKPAISYGGLIVEDSVAYVSGIAVSNYPPYFAKTYLSKFDLNGNSLDNKIFDPYDTMYTGSWENALMKTSDGYFLNVGYTAHAYTGYDKALLFKHNASLNMHFFKTYAKPIGVFAFSFNSVAETNDGYYCLGDYYYDNPPSSDIVLLKTDFNGHETNRVSIGTTQYEEAAFDFTKVSEGYYFIAGDKATSLSPDSSALFSHQYYLKVDGNCNILDTWVDPVMGGFTVRSIIESSDSTVTFCGAYAGDIVYGGGGYWTLGGVGEIKTIRKDDYSTVWDLRMSYPTVFTQFWEIKQLPDKSFIAAGELIDTIGTDSTSGDLEFGHPGWLVKVSPKGQLIWQREYYGVQDGGPYWNFLNDFELLPNGDILACGQATSGLNNDSFPERGWLIKLDSCGCLVPGCQNVGIKEQGIEKPKFIKIFPNPANDWIYIYFNAPQGTNIKDFSFNVTDLNGQMHDYQQKINIASTYFLSISNYASGIYFVNLIENGERVQTEEFIKQ